MTETIKFRAPISPLTIIGFTLEDLVRPNPGFSIRELVIPWLRLGNKPDRYIDLKDCKGVEIYEGDIVSMPYSRCPQHWQVLEMSAYGQRFLRVTAKPYAMPHYFRGLHHFDECEVIGNIYRNPELMEVQK